MCGPTIYFYWLFYFSSVSKYKYPTPRICFWILTMNEFSCLYLLFPILLITEMAVIFNIFRRTCQCFNMIRKEPLGFFLRKYEDMNLSFVITPFLQVSEYLFWYLLFFFNPYFYFTRNVTLFRNYRKGYSVVLNIFYHNFVSC